MIAVSFVNAGSSPIVRESPKAGGDRPRVVDQMSRRGLLRAQTDGVGRKRVRSSSMGVLVVTGRGCVETYISAILNE